MVNQFKVCRTSVDSEPCSGWPSSSQNDQVIAKVNAVVIRDPRVTMRKIVDAVRRKRLDAISTSITTMLQHIPHTWFTLFWQKTRPLCFARFLTLLIWFPATLGCSPYSRCHWKKSDFRQDRTLLLQQQPS